MSLLITRNKYANNDGNSRYFIPFLRLVIYTNILSVIRVGVSGVVDPMVAYQT